MANSIPYQLYKQLRKHSTPIEVYKHFVTLAAPRVGYKKAIDINGDHVIITLVIPKNATVYIGPKPAKDAEKKQYRCDEAYVVDIQHLDDNRMLNIAFSAWDDNFEYGVGKRIEPEDFSFERNECEAGIHFYMSGDEAFDH